MSINLKYKLTNFDQFTNIFNDLEPYLNPKSIFLLHGDLGAGKTTLVSYISKKLNLTGVSSPTYSLIQEYKGLGYHLIHVDLYRLETQDEIESSGFWEIFLNTEALVFIEWPSRVQIEDLPLDWKIIRVELER